MTMKTHMSIHSFTSCPFHQLIKLHYGSNFWWFVRLRSHYHLHQLMYSMTQPVFRECEGTVDICSHQFVGYFTHHICSQSSSFDNTYNITEMIHITSRCKFVSHFNCNLHNTNTPLKGWLVQIIWCLWVV